MKIRLISGTCYIAILAVAFLLKIFVHDLCFDALVYLFSVIGGFEMLRAMGEKTTKTQKAIVFGFNLVCVPGCALMEGLLFGGGHGVAFLSALYFVLAVTELSLLVAKHEETSLESVGVSLLSATYPTLFLGLLTLTNHISGVFSSDLAILFIFVISPIADSLAYVFGRFLKKYFPKKMAPVVSPNKTVIGGIGGLVGGVLGGGLLYVIYNAVAGSFEKVYLYLPIYLGVGLLLAVATAFGDLVESCVKRKVGLKDMGKIMPGHGGVLDRIDGSMFATVAVYACFILLNAIL